jgi:hypothetical protein
MGQFAFGITHCCIAFSQLENCTHGGDCKLFAMVPFYLVTAM